MDEKRVDVEIVRVKCSNEECGKISIHSKDEIEELGSVKCEECGNSQYIAKS